MHQIICCDLPHGESSKLPPSLHPQQPPPLTRCSSQDESPFGVGVDCCFDFVQPCDSPDCERDTICDDLECVISQRVPPCAGCGEARMEMRGSGSKEGGERSSRDDDHVLIAGGATGEGEGQVIECSCGFRESWDCGVSELGDFEQFLDCCHPSYTPFPSLPIDLMAPEKDPLPESEESSSGDRGLTSAFGSPLVESDSSSGSVPEFLPNVFTPSQPQRPPPPASSSSDDLYSNFSILLDAALSSTATSPSINFQQQQGFNPQQQQPSFDAFTNSTFLSPSFSTSFPLANPSPLNCEWSDCNESFPSLDRLVEHFKSTSSHLPLPDPSVSSSPFSFDAQSNPSTEQQVQALPSMTVLTCQWGSDPHLLTSAANMVAEENANGQGTGGGAVETSPSEILLQHLLRDHLAGFFPLKSLGHQQSFPGLMDVAMDGEGMMRPVVASDGGGGDLFGPSLSSTCDPQHHVYNGDPNEAFTGFGQHACEMVESLIRTASEAPSSDGESSTHKRSFFHPSQSSHSHHSHPHPYHHAHAHHNHLHAHQHSHVHLPHHHLHPHHSFHHHPHTHHRFAHSTKIVTPSLRSNSVTSLQSAAGNTIHACGYPDCDAVYEDTTALTEHINNVHVGSGKDSYSCGWEGCERGIIGPIFKSKQKIMRHIQAHTGHKPFVCPTCSQTFSEAATLAQHQRRHTNEKPFVCDHPGCEKAFTLVASLTIHKRTHDGVKPFACPHCDRAFVEASNLTKHIRTHTGDKPFPCSKCEKRFARPDQLSRHQSVHTRKEAIANGTYVKAGGASSSAGSSLIGGMGRGGGTEEGLVFA